MSYADEIFVSTCKDILENGEEYLCERGFDKEGNKLYAVWEDGTPAKAIGKFAVINKYDLSKEFPIITLRRTYFKSLVDEILWIWQKKSNCIKDLNSNVWNEWADETGSIGKAYGYQLGVKHKYKEGEFDQVDRVLYDLKTNPQSRRIMTNLYNHHDLNEMRLYPCAYGVTLNVKNGKLNMILNQRSQDMLTANGWNVSQYAVLQHMLAQVSGFEVGELCHVIADAHIYDKHIPIVKELITKNSSKAPKFYINKDIQNFYDFTLNDFNLIDYKYGMDIKNIPIAT